MPIPAEILGTLPELLVMADKIESVCARQVLDSRGNPTVEAVVKTAQGSFSAITPSGASTGIYEAVELRDGEKAYGGLGVQKAVANVKGPIAKEIAGMDVAQQKSIDEKMLRLDGTPNKARLGANAIVAVSMAVCRAAAASMNMPLYEYVASMYRPKAQNLLPVPMLNVVNGGKHASGGLACQELMIQPAYAKSYSSALMESAEVYHALKKAIKAKFGGTYANLGDEGGFVPPVKTMAEALGLFQGIIDGLGYAEDFVFATDLAASNFYEDGKYTLDGKVFGADGLAEYYLSMQKNQKLLSIEDGFHEDGFDEFARLTRRTKYQVVGDDLLVTNPERIRKAVQMKSCNALLLKVNQVGSVSESLEAARTAHGAGWNVVVSHRSGEAEDSFIADFAVGIGAGQIKTGAPARGERNCKYNQLLRIEEELGSGARYRNPYAN
jgi:enolase